MNALLFDRHDRICAPESLLREAVAASAYQHCDPPTLNLTAVTRISYAQSTAS
jgi:hypothetical protein